MQTQIDFLRIGNPMISVRDYKSQTAEVLVNICPRGLSDAGGDNWFVELGFNELVRSIGTLGVL